jgi:hypothetical protein
MNLFKRVIKPKPVKIKFLNSKAIDDAYKPQPARKDLPSWYRDQEAFMGGKKGLMRDANTGNATIKRCVPVLDMLMSGYILYTPVDIWVSNNERGEYGFNWKGYEVIGDHDKAQLKNHPYIDSSPNKLPKIVNPWSITTEPGYSCMFINPPHRESVFRIFEGIVDTDTYNIPVNLPFVFNDPLFQGLIPAGTPMALVIPFKRDSFECVVETLNESNADRIDKQNTTMISHYYDTYRRLFWAGKDYN